MMLESTRSMDLENWQPYSPSQLHALFQHKSFRYWIAGGRALQLFVGQPYREHADIDVVIPRPDQLECQQALRGFACYAADPPGRLRPWVPKEFLPWPIHDIWVKARPDGPFVFQLMLIDTAANRWLFKRNPAITGPLSEFGQNTPDGIPIIRPEIQLLYKAKSVRQKDQHDFRVCLPRMNRDQRRWLAGALRRAHSGHAWIKALDGHAPDP